MDAVLGMLNDVATPPPLVDLADSANGAIASGWAKVVNATGGEAEDYFRLCLLPSLGSVALFWAFNVPLLFGNFFPTYNPLERWKVQKGRYETAERVFWMLATVLLNQSIGMAISATPQNYVRLCRCPSCVPLLLAAPR